MSPFIETYTGQRFQPLEPRIANIWITDIAHALSHQCRFSGHTSVHYSVAEHSVRVSERVEQLGGTLLERKEALLHDGSEAFCQDMPAPMKARPWGFVDFLEALKAAIVALLGGNVVAAVWIAFAWGYFMIEERIQKAIRMRFGLPERESPIVRKADLELLATEARDLMAYKPEHWAGLTERPLPEQITPWNHETAKRNFLARFEQVSQ